MGYRILTLEDIPKFLGSLEEMRNIFTDFNNLEVGEVFHSGYSTNDQTEQSLGCYCSN
jgi:hypothetical protein